MPVCLDARSVIGASRETRLQPPLPLQSPAEMHGLSPHRAKPRAASALGLQSTAGPAPGHWPQPCGFSPGPRSAPKVLLPGPSSASRGPEGQPRSRPALGGSLVSQKPRRPSPGRCHGRVQQRRRGDARGARAVREPMRSRGDHCFQSRLPRRVGGPRSPAAWESRGHGGALLLTGCTLPSERSQPCPKSPVCSTMAPAGSSGTLSLN